MSFSLNVFIQKKYSNISVLNGKLLNNNANKITPHAQISEAVEFFSPKNNSGAAYTGEPRQGLISDSNELRPKSVIFNWVGSNLFESLSLFVPPTNKFSNFKS